MSRNHRNLILATGRRIAVGILASVGLSTMVKAELAITGVGEDLARNIRTYASIAAEPCNAESWRIRRRFRALEREARRALEPFGYYRVEMTASLRFEEACWVAELDITPGEPVQLRAVDVRITGAAQADRGFDELLRHPALAPGGRLDHAAYERYKRNLQVTAADRGYVEAEFAASRIDVWPDEGVADIELQFDSGPRYNLGEIQQSQTFLTPRLVDGYMNLETGMPFDRNALSDAHSSLSDSGYFSRIQLFPDFEAAADGQIPLRVELEPANRIEYSFGAGFSTDTGPRFRAGFRNNRLNQRGHRLKTDLNVSEVRQGINGEYRIPLKDPRSEWMSYTASVAREKTNTFESDTIAVGVRRTRRISSTWLRTLAIDLTDDSFIVGEDIDNSFLIVPSLTFDHKNASRDIYPTSGRRFTVETLGTSDAIGSTTSFAQVTAWTRWIRSFGSKTRLIARATAGYTEAANFAELPPSVRYFAGGDQSIRGYALDSLGPTDEDGNVVGGTRLLVGSVEFERQVRGNFYGAAFVDAGNAYSNEEFDPAVGVGLGVIWRSPVGPVRFYVGFPLDKDKVNPRIHLRLGTDL